ncbi:uncharacterized protein LOC117565654 [Drosophila albomicans]|uniref:Uncharacterized protein LOC117565654 n=1 Tax=Drosophila albomicans TaxID=7291 RepID=A0A6P8WN42_DROAB|nr:uncharacterized protein LOC117565654 [Drosophila albomicans]
MENQGENAQESPIDKVVMALYEYDRLVRESYEKCFNTIIRLTEERNLLKSMNRMYEEREMKRVQRKKKRRLKRQAKKKRAKEFAKKKRAKELTQLKQEVNSTSKTTIIQLGKAEP